MAEFVPTEQIDIDFVNGLVGKVIMPSVVLPSGATLPVLEADEVWKAQTGKLVSVHAGLPPSMMR
jgi:hypothetical protein